MLIDQAGKISSLSRCKIVYTLLSSYKGTALMGKSSQ